MKKILDEVLKKFREHLKLNSEKFGGKVFDKISCSSNRILYCVEKCKFLEKINKKENWETRGNISGKFQGTFEKMLGKFQANDGKISSKWREHFEKNLTEN